jgi:protein phosphatase 1L
VARAFGDKSLKAHLSAQPDIKRVEIDDGTDFLILASDGLWKVDTFAEAKTKHLCQLFEDSNLDIL